MLAHPLFQSLILAVENGLSDIRGIVPSPDLRPWIGSAAALVLLGALVLWIRSRSRRTAPPEPREPPDVRALRRLDALERSGAALDAERFTLEVSSILRSYLEEALDVPAPGQTSEEFLRDLRNQPRVTPQLQEDLEDFARLTDLVKFARRSLADAERERLLASAGRVVETCRPEPEPVRC